MKDIKKIQQTLEREMVDAWLFINDAGKDPYFKKYIAPNTSVITVAVITKKDVTVFVSGLERELIEAHVLDANIKVFSREKGDTLNDLMVKYFEYNSELKKIALNYSTMNDASTDILGHGFYKYYTDMLIESVNHLEEKSFLSAENIIYALIDSKTEEEIKKLSISAQRALEILENTFPHIKVGMTELQLIELVHEITEKTRDKFLEKYKGYVIEENYSWEEECCPIVLTGKSFEKGGHALSTETIIDYGNTVYFDFGVCLTFDNGDRFSSDIQRTVYKLRQEEQDAPLHIKQRFEDIINSISIGIENIKIGMYGYEVDDLVRSYLLKKGYPNYDHSTGHAIGEEAHNPGTNLTPSKTGTGALKIQPNGTYTIEPRIPLENGVSIEEMVVVRENGKVDTLCNRQTKIIMI
jgi:Xaa-Pro aminopeptidase